MFLNTPTNVPVTPTMSLNVHGVDCRRVSDASNDVHVTPLLTKKVRTQESRVQVATAVHRATANTNDLGALLITPVMSEGALKASECLVCPEVPKKSASSKSRIPVTSKATEGLGNVSKNTPRAPTSVAPITVSVLKEADVVPTTPARGLPYRAASTWGPRRGTPVSVLTIEAKAVASKVGSVVHTPAPTASIANPVKHQELVKSPTLELDLEQDISRRVLHRASDIVVTYRAPLSIPLPKQPARSEAPPTQKPARTVDKLTKIKVSQPGDAYATLMLHGVVDQTPGHKGQVTIPEALTKSGGGSSRSAPAKDLSKFEKTVVSTPTKSVSVRCVTRSTADTQVVTSQQATTRAPTEPVKNGKASKFRTIEEIVRLEYCVVDFYPESVSDVCTKRGLTSIEKVIASECAIVDKAEVVIPAAPRSVTVPKAPRKMMQTRSLRFLKKVSRLVSSRGIEDE